MKKILVIGTLGLVAVLALGVAGLAYAQSQTPSAPGANPGAFGQGMMGGYGRGMMARQAGQTTPPTAPNTNGGYGRGMMGGFRGQAAVGMEGPLHDYMVAGFAEAFNMTPEQLETRLDAGDTMWVIAQEQGLTQEQFSELMVQVRTDALNQAVADGIITQAQADFMLQRMAQMQANGFGPGSCVGGGAGRGPGRMFPNAAPAAPAQP